LKIINSYLKTEYGLTLEGKLHPIPILLYAYLPEHYKIATGITCKISGKIGTNLSQFRNLPHFEVRHRFFCS
tara:strand:+ start:2702 stop:2917 length:216 start_codon:yes stop_codon:yes gene_type:complete